MRLSRAIDLWLGDLARGGRTRATRFAYQRYLFKFVDHVDRSRLDADVREVTVNDCRAFLDRWTDSAPSTGGSIHSALNGLFSWLYVEGEVDANPMLRIARPRRLRPEDVPVVTVTRAEVEKMFAATEGWQEFLCLTLLAYTGVRRDSAARLRWRDVDLTEGLISFREKGGKQSVKPMAWELLSILRAAVDSGEVPCRPGDHVIPNRRAASVRRTGRSNKVIWETVVTVAERAGVKATTHALRRAFAVEFLETHPGALEALRVLMNHSRVDTTQVYLRALNRSQAMEAVRDLSWGPGFQPKAVEAHTGFEPVLPP